MPAICRLDSVWCTRCDAARILRRAVTSNESDPGPVAQPQGQRVSGAIGEQIKGTTPLKIDNDRAIALPLPHRPVIDADHSRQRGSRERRAPDKTQYCCRACRHAKVPGQPGSGFAAECNADPTLHTHQPSGPLGSGRDKRRELLPKGTPAAAGGRAGEPPHAQLKTNAKAKQRKIGGSAPVIPVDGG
jgi:hypothetical protein